LPSTKNLLDEPLPAALVERPIAARLEELGVVPGR
jgi:hypothetical protein